MVNFKYLKIAREISKTSSFPRIHIGAVIVYKKDIISVGANLSKSHPIQKKFNILREGKKKEFSFIHAEMAAIIKAKFDLKGADIYIYREDLNGNLACCKPCPACMKMIKDTGIKRIIYTDSSGVKTIIL